jgi:RNA recognition motif-containing protein
MGSKLYVGGLPYSATQTELTDLFSSHGTVQSANVISDRAGLDLLKCHLEKKLRLPFQP